VIFCAIFFLIFLTCDRRESENAKKNKVVVRNHLRLYRVSLLSQVAKRPIGGRRKSEKCKKMKIPPKFGRDHVARGGEGALDQTCPSESSLNPRTYDLNPSP